MKYIEVAVGETTSLTGQLLTFIGYDDQNIILKDVRTGKTYVHGRAAADSTFKQYGIKFIYGSSGEA